ncbi:sigma-70 family RNA polymerase sigma factor [Deinococcus sp. YIM 134068]|uniref:sigma-70 family RNA polymerase sigma factor n=1 Tax=Deinococcus lichenicola TaxID=3118910 RepID=UPI002F951ECF
MTWRLAEVAWLRGRRDGTADPVADDAALAGRLRGRDEAALAEVYDRHAGAVYGVLVRLLGEAGAADTLQDVFLGLWDRPERYDPARAGLRAYLLVVARSRALDRLRAERGHLPLVDEDGEALALPDAQPGPGERAERAGQGERVRAGLAHLSAAHRETVSRAFLQGQSREEIAGAMGVPVGTVKSRLHAALTHLRRVLGEEAGTWLD